MAYFVAGGLAEIQALQHDGLLSTDSTAPPTNFPTNWPPACFSRRKPLHHYRPFGPAWVYPMSLAPQLFDDAGRRKYLSNDELARFIRAAQTADPHVRDFCLLLAHAGCRISEALAVTPQHLDRENRRVIFRTLKRRRTVFRAVPIPDALMAHLSRLARDRADESRLWPWARQTAWRKVKVMMDRAGIEGVMASPKGLRHAYGIKAAASNVPQSLIQRWLGHAKPDTTLIYMDAVGVEERQFAQRMWRT